MRVLEIDNYVITTSIFEILQKLRLCLSNGKLKDIKVNTDDIVVTCPHHANGREANADCNIYIGNDSKIPYGFARCFACEFKGSFVRFVQECFESSEDFAKHWLIDNFGEAKGEALIIDDEICLTKNNNYLNESLLDQYEKWTPYLAKRKLSRDICEKLKIRYDPHFRQVIFPIYDIYGHLKMLAKRSIDTKTFYLNKNQEKEVYGLNIIQKNNIKSCIITEGPFDMARSWEFGLPAIATLGTISDYQIEQINKSCITTIYSMFDNDEAGKRFTEILSKKVSKRILIINIKLPYSCKDVNDLSDEQFSKIYNEQILAKNIC